MNDSKGYTQDDINSIAGDGKGASEKYGTFADRRDMERMGKTQKLRVGIPLREAVRLLTS